MKKKIVWLVVSCLMVAALLLASCAPAVVEEEKVAPPVKEEVVVPKEEVVVPKEEVVTEGKEMVQDSLGRLVEKPRYGGVFTWIWPKEDPRHDVLVGSGPITGASHQMQTVDPFRTVRDWSKGPTGTGEHQAYDQGYFPEYFSGMLAESWEIIPPNTIVLQIRQGVHFQDKPPANGRLMTIDDVVYNIKLYYSVPRTYFTQRYPFLADMENLDNSVQKTGPWEITVKTKPEYLAACWEGLGSMVFVIPPEARELWGDLNDWKHLQGIGPFMVTDYVSGSVITFKKHANYWMKDPFFPENQLPYLDGARILIIPDAATRLAGLRTSKIDILDELPKEDADSLMRSNPELKWKKQLVNYYEDLWMRHDVAPFDDINVRRAMMMAIDHKAILEQYYEGDGIQLAFPAAATKEWAAYQPTVEELPEDLRELFEYNPDKARQLLAEAGYPDGFKTSILVYSPVQTDLASIIETYWAKVGVTMELRVKEYGVYNSMMKRFTHEHGLMDTYNPSKSVFKHLDLRPQVDGNHIRNTNELPEEIFMKSFSGEIYTDPAARAAYHKSVAPELIGQVFSFMLPAPYGYVMWQPWIKGYNGEMRVNSAQEFTFTQYIWIDQDLKEEMTGRR
ncbi:ABC transporter substrate-binding protein [Chloroflexota bacterium]